MLIIYAGEDQEKKSEVDKLMHKHREWPWGKDASKT